MLDLLKKLRLLLSPRDKISLIGVALLMTCSSLLEMAGIGALVAAVTVFLAPEAVVSNAKISKIAELLNSCNDPGRFVWILAALGVLFAAKNLFSLWIIHISSHILFNKQCDISLRLYSSYLKSDYKSVSARQVADLDINIHNCSLLCPYVLMPLAQLASDGLTILLLGGALAAAMPLVTVSGIFFMALCGGAIQLASSKINRVFGERCAKAEIENSRIRLSGLSDIAYIKSVGAEEFFLGRSQKSERESNYCNSRLYFLGQIPRLALETAAIILLIGIFIIMLKRGVSNAEILAVFTAIVAVMARILPALSRCHYSLMRIRQSKFMFDCISDDITGFPQENAAVSGSCATIERELVLENVSYLHAGASRPTPENLSLTIPARTSIGIAGKTGCGKTTLIELLLGLRRPTSGSIKSDGIDIFNDVREWRKKIGYVPQTVHLIAGTLQENIAFGIPPELVDKDKIARAISLAQLDGFTPEHKISADGTNLSGGQRQRIGIARALYRDVELLILDEATSNLDQDTENAFISALETLNGKLTMVVIAHRLNTLEKCDRVIDLNKE